MAKIIYINGNGAIKLKPHDAIYSIELASDISIIMDVYNLPAQCEIKTNSEEWAIINAVMVFNHKAEGRRFVDPLTVIGMYFDCLAESKEIERLDDFDGWD